MDDQLRNAIEAVRMRLQAELEAQLATVERQQTELMDAARRAADVEAHERWAVKLEQVRAEWASRLETELAAAAADADRRTVAECTRARLETEQAAAEAMARLRQETNSEVERARAEAQKSIEDVLRLTRELEEARATTDTDRAAKPAPQAESAGITEARAVERHTQLAIVERLLDSVRAISGANSLTEVLDTLVAGAAGEVPRVALLLVEGQELHGFRVSGFDEAAASARFPVSERGALQQAVESGEPVSVTSSNAPKFGNLPADRAGLALPLNVGGRTVGVLYADDASPGDPDAPASWPEAIQILTQFAAAMLAQLTAIRSAQALRFTSGAAASGQSSSSFRTNDDQAARRYARLLVSEIKLYNEAAVRTGRERKDLLARLGPEVERARRLYEERVPPAIAARGEYFHQELVQTLADGDPALLGTSVVPS